MGGSGKKGVDTTLVLKVDVDTLVGLTDGVRRLADIMAETGVRASYYMSMGPDNSGRALRRLTRPGFLKKQLRSGAASAFGLRTMLYGVLLPGPIIARQAPGVFSRLVGEGHEVGVHCWDHVYWHDRMRWLEPSLVERELRLAFDLFEEITGFQAATFASAGWQVTREAYRTLIDLGVSHTSCTRGSHPFFPRYGDEVLPVMEIPSTLPTMDEVLGRDGFTEANVAARLADMVRPGELNVYTLHGEVEGRGQAPIFREFCQRLLDRGVRFLRLVDAAREILERGIPPVDRVVFGEIPGRAGDVGLQESSWQGGSS